MFYAPAGEYGGAHSLLPILEQAAGRFQAFIVCPAPSTLSSGLNKLGVEYYPFRFNRYALKHRPDWHIRMIWKLFRLIRSRSIDVVVVNHTGNFSLIMLAAWLARVPVVRFMRHSLSYFSGHGFNRTDRLFLPRCRGLICITRHIEAETQRSLPNCPPTITLYNPQPVASDGQLKNLDALRTELGIEGNSPVLGVFGRVEPIKGQDILIAAVARLVARFPNLRLLIVGDSSRPAYRAELNSAIQTHNLGRNALFLGRRDDVLRLLSLCAIAVIPSRSEALGRVLLEAWAVGRPVIGSDIEGIREVVTASNGGLLFASESVEELSAHIEVLLDDAELRERLANNGRRWLMENCDPERYADRFMSFLTQVIAGSPRSVVGTSSMPAKV